MPEMGAKGRGTCSEIRCFAFGKVAPSEFRGRVLYCRGLDKSAVKEDFPRIFPGIFLQFRRVLKDRTSEDALPDVGESLR